MSKTGKKRKKWVIIIVCAAICAVFIAFRAAAALSAPKGIEVDTSEAVVQNLTSSLSGSGTLGSLNTKSYYAPVTAIVNECNLKEGSPIASGTKVIGFDTSALEEENQKAALTSDAALNGYKDTLNKADQAASDRETALNDSANYQANIDSVNASIRDYTKAIAARKAEITAKNGQMAGSASAVDPESDATLLAYQQALTDLQSQLSEYQSKKAEADSKASALESAVLSDAARAQINDNINLASMEASAASDQLETAKQGVISDFDGVVTKMLVSNGTAVTKGTELFTVSSIHDACVNVNLTKATFGSVKVGQKAVIKFNDYTYDGVVTEVAKAASSGASSLSSLNSASGSSSSSSSSLTQGASGVTATVKINNPDDHLCLGLDAKVEIQTDAKNNVLQIPKNCVNMSTDGTFCYAVENGKAVKKMIETGISSDDMIEVKSGLDAGAKVIVNAPDGVSDQTAVLTSAEGN